MSNVIQGCALSYNLKVNKEELPSFINCYKVKHILYNTDSNTSICQSKNSKIQLKPVNHINKWNLKKKLLWKMFAKGQSWNVYSACQINEQFSILQFQMKIVLNNKILK